VSGLTAATGAAEVTHSFRIALVIAAIVAGAAAPLSFIGLSPRVRARRSARSVFCSVDGPPLQPDPELCPPIRVVRT
jgi:hypothetical protein